MSDKILENIVKEVVWKHNPLKVRKMSVTKFVEEVEHLARMIGFEPTGNDYRRAISITLQATK